MLSEKRELDAYSQLASLIKAMAHPTRLYILDILAGGEACVCHLTTVLKKRQPYVSQHLMLLREADLVQDRRDGVIVYYRLANAQIAEVVGHLHDAVQARVPGIRFHEIPPSPVAGCPCPKCLDGGDAD